MSSPQRAETETLPHSAPPHPLQTCFIQMVLWPHQHLTLRTERWRMVNSALLLVAHGYVQQNRTHVWLLPGRQSPWAPLCRGKETSEHPHPCKKSGAVTDLTVGPVLCKVGTGESLGSAGCQPCCGLIERPCFKDESDRTGHPVSSSGRCTRGMCVSEHMHVHTPLSLI